MSAAIENQTHTIRVCLHRYLNNQYEYKFDCKPTLRELLDHLAEEVEEEIEERLGISISLCGEGVLEYRYLSFDIKIDGERVIEVDKYFEIDKCWYT